VVDRRTCDAGQVSAGGNRRLTGSVRLEEIRALSDRARGEADRGRILSAARLATRALQLLRTHSPNENALHARILLTLSHQKAVLGELDEASTLLDDTERIDPSFGPLVETNRGQLLASIGRLEEAIPHFDQAIRGLSADVSHHGFEQLANALLNRGVLQMSAGHLRAAQRDTEAAAKAAKSSGVDVLDFMTTHNLGYIRFLSGDLPGALETMAAASELLPSGATGVPAMDRARVLLSAGLIGEAKESIELAVESFAANRATPDLAEALQVSAEVNLAMGDPAAARTAARRAARIAGRRGNERAAMVVDLLAQRAAGLARRRQALSVGRASRDAASAGELAARLSAADLVEDARVARLLQAEALLDVGDVAGAEQALAAASGVNRSVSSTGLSVKLHTRLVSSRIAIATGSPAAGMTQIRRGLDELADFQARFGSQDLQSAASIHGRELARLGLRTAIGTGSPAAILQWLERSRAVTTRLPAVRPPADPVLAEELGALRVADDQARTALLAGKRDLAADRRVAELRRRVRARSWTASGSGRAGRPPSLAAVRRALADNRPDAGVVALFAGGGQIHALVITAHRARYLVLADRADLELHRHRLQSDLDLLADDRLPAPFAAVATRSMAASLDRLSAAFEPVLGLLGGGPVLIAAVGPLATVPWLLLPGLRGRPVAVSSSVTTAIAQLAAPGSRPSDHGVLVVAGPDVTNADKEAGTIASLHRGATLLTGEQATGRAVLAAMPSGGLVHIAAHGHHEVGNPLFSGVKLADGLLFGYDFAPNPSLPGQVVLSSCDVGQSDERPGGEPLGLVAALLRSSVPTVVAGTSRIADSVAELTMVAYHEALLAGQQPAAALAGAVEVARDTTGLPAPFTCFGAGL
jgi:tetratricopeptide (TPR) repeat protein